MIGTRCVVLPNLPPIDKYIAYKRVLLDEGRFHGLRVVFCDVIDVTSEHLERWQSMCSNGLRPILIDVGEANAKARGMASASQMQQLASSVQGSRIWNELVEMANRNNQTGYLKNFRHSIAKLIRQFYHVVPDQESVFYRGMDVVNSFFWPTNKRGWDSLFTNEEYSGLRRLWEGFGVGDEEVQPFTIPTYFRQLFMSGRSLPEIHEKITWWINKDRQVQSRFAMAKRKIFPVSHFSINGEPAGLVRVADFFEAGAFAQDWLTGKRIKVAISKMPRGHTTIQCSRFRRQRNGDFESLHQELASREPGQWHLEKFAYAPVIMNGSWQFTGIKPTSLSDSELMRLVCKHLR